MSNQMFSGTGNLGADPEIKTVKGKDGEVEIAEMRIMFDRFVGQDDNREEKGGFWLTCTDWSKYRVPSIKEHLKKGARVTVEGEMINDPWDDDGKTRDSLRCRITNITLSLSRINTVTFKAATGSNS